MRRNWFSKDTSDCALRDIKSIARRGAGWRLGWPRCRLDAKVLCQRGNRKIEVERITVHNSLPFDLEVTEVELDQVIGLLDPQYVVLGRRRNRQ